MTNTINSQSVVKTQLEKFHRPCHIFNIVGYNSLSRFLANIIVPGNLSEFCMFLYTAMMCIIVNTFSQRVNGIQEEVSQVWETLNQDDAALRSDEARTSFIIRSDLDINIGVMGLNSSRILNLKENFITLILIWNKFKEIINLGLLLSVVFSQVIVILSSYASLIGFSTVGVTHLSFMYVFLSHVLIIVVVNVYKIALMAEAGQNLEKSVNWV